jgi:hypothetical protein
MRINAIVKNIPTTFNLTGIFPATLGYLPVRIDTNLQSITGFTLSKSEWGENWFLLQRSKEKTTKTPATHQKL